MKKYRYPITDAVTFALVMQEEVLFEDEEAVYDIYKAGKALYIFEMFDKN